MRFWDSSAIVPLLVAEKSTAAVTRVLESDPELIVWWATGVECVSALARLERDQAVAPEVIAIATGRLDRFAAGWEEVQPIAQVRRTATRLLRVHALRAADAFQLAAAIAAAEDHPETLPFVTLDERLVQAAQREGFEVMRPT